MALVKGTNCGFVSAAPSGDPAGTAIDIYGAAFAIKDSAPAGANKITEIGWYSDVISEEANFEVGVYEHNSGDDNPEAAVHIEATNAKGTTAGWKKVTGLNISITPETIYWLAVQCDTTVTHSKIDWSAAGGERSDYKTSMAALPDPWGASNGQEAYVTAIYALYETAAPSGSKSSGSIKKDMSASDDPPGLYE